MKNKKQKTKNSKYGLDLLVTVLTVGLVGTAMVGILGNVKEPSAPEEEPSGPKVLELCENLNTTLANASGDCVLTVEGDLPLIVEDSQTILGAEGVERIVIDGNGEASITAEGAKQSVVSLASGTLVLKNITINDNTPVKYNNFKNFLYFGGNVIFENCVFTNSIYLKETSTASFVNCTFQSVLEKCYGVWVGNGDVTFENCTFEGYRALKIHEFDETENVDSVLIENCLFDNIAEKVGVVIGDVDSTTAISLKNNVFDGCLNYDSESCVAGVDGFYESDTALTDFTLELIDNEVKNVRFCYTITYKVMSGTTEKNSWLNYMLAPDVVYPDKAFAGETVVIPDLVEGTYVNGTKTYKLMFQGWFYDAELTLPVEGEIVLNSNLVLYASCLYERI